MDRGSADPTRLIPSDAIGPFLHLTLAGWAVLETSLRVRELARGKGRSAHDRATRALIGLAVGAAIALAARSGSLAPSLHTGGPHRAAGLILMWLGLALAVCVVLPLAALLWRIRVEEAEMVRVLGDPYRTYQQRTKRLVPGLW